MKYCVILFLVLLFSFTACKNHSGISPIPAIAFEDMAPDSLKQGASEDTVYIKFRLTDGDADLGNDKNGTQYDIYIKDNHSDTFQGYFFPDIDQRIEDPAKGLTGTCVYKLLGAITYIRPDSIHQALGDTVQYELYIKDKAGNASNHITTPNVYIRP